MAPAWLTPAWRRSKPSSDPEPKGEHSNGHAEGESNGEEAPGGIQTRVPLDYETSGVLGHLKALWQSERDEIKRTTVSYTWYDWLAYFIPAFAWLRTYKWKGWLYRDVLAGLCVAVMVIPQGMSYAQNLAYLPQVYGLYGSFVPCILYALLGSSKQLAVGPVAITSLLLGNGLTNIFGNFQINPSDPGDALQAALQMRYNRAAIQVAFVAGMFYTMVGILRMGWVINVMSLPVVSGFMSGAATVIISGQIKYITGQKLPRVQTAYEAFRLIFLNLNLFKWREFVMGGTFILLLIFCLVVGRRVKRLRFLQFIGPLLVCVISIAIMNIWKLYVFNPDIPGTPFIAPVGSIPAGMPEFTAGWWLPLYHAKEQLLLSLLICLLDIVESTSIARALAQKNRYKLQATQELRGLGLANLGGAMFNCYTTTGSFSRSAVNNSVGAKTQMAGVVTGATVGLVLAVLTPVFTHMSANVQGAIVIVGCLSLYDFPTLFYCWRVNKLDFLCWIVAFIVVFFEGPEIGIGVAVALSIALFVIRNAFPKVLALRRLRDEPEGVGPAYGPADLYADHADRLADGILAVRVEAPLFFGNVQVVRENIERQLDIARFEGHAVLVVVLDLATATDCDVAATQFLTGYKEELERDGVSLVLANPTPAVMLALRRAKAVPVIGAINIQATLAEAMTRAQEIAGPKMADKKV